jgi:hypothetical protein
MKINRRQINAASPAEGDRLTDKYASRWKIRKVTSDHVIIEPCEKDRSLCSGFIDWSKPNG